MAYVRFVLTIIFSSAFLVAVHGIALIFDRLGLVQPELPTRLDQWLPVYFRYAGWFGIGITSFGNILWYILGQWVFKINDYASAGKRGWWIGLFLFPIAGVLVSLFVLIVKPVQGGVFWIVLFSIVVPIACYWLVTVLFSPLLFKYTPWGASKVRYW